MTLNLQNNPRDDHGWHDVSLTSTVKCFECSASCSEASAPKCCSGIMPVSASRWKEQISLWEPQHSGVTKEGTAASALPPPTVSESIMAVTQHQGTQWLNLFVYRILDWSSEWKNECTHQGNPHVTVPWRNRRDMGQSSFSPGNLENQISFADLQSGSRPGQRVLQRYTWAQLPRLLKCDFLHVLVSNWLFHVSTTWTCRLISDRARRAAHLLANTYRHVKNELWPKFFSWVLGAGVPQVSVCCWETDMKELIVWRWGQLDGMKG